MPRRKRQMTHIELDGQAYHIGYGGTLSVLGKDNTNLFTIESLGGNMIRVHRGNAFWDGKSEHHTV